MLPIDSVGIAIPGVYLDGRAGYFHRKVEFVEFNAFCSPGINFCASKAERGD